jgi:hypothetical protein
MSTRCSWPSIDGASLVAGFTRLNELFDEIAQFHHKLIVTEDRNCSDCGPLVRHYAVVFRSNYDYIQAEQTSAETNDSIKHSRKQKEVEHDQSSQL